MVFMIVSRKRALLWYTILKPEEVTMGSFEANKIRARAGVFSARSDKTWKTFEWFVVRSTEAANNNRDNERKILFESFVRSRRIIITNFRTIIFFKLNEYLETNITLN